MARLLVLPGTAWQLSLIRKIYEMGHEALVVNPRWVAGVTELADEFLDSDIFDLDRVECFARGRRVDGIVSDECDVAVPVVAELGRRLGLPAPSPEAAALFRDKSLMRSLAESVGLGRVEHGLCADTDAVVSFLRDFGTPIVVKPVDGTASRGVSRVATVCQAQESFDAALAHSRSGRVMAERWVEGPEFTVDGLMTPAGHFTLAISEKRHYAHNPCVARELIFSHAGESVDYARLRATNDRLMGATPLEFGLTHAEYKYEGSEFRLMEMGARGGGNLISSVIVPFMSGHDTQRYLIECALGDIRCGQFEVPEALLGRAAALKFLQVPRAGVVEDVVGVDSLEREPDVVAHGIGVAPGDVVSGPTSDSERAGFYIACSESMGELRGVMGRVESSVRVIVR